MSPIERLSAWLEQTHVYDNRFLDGLVELGRDLLHVDGWNTPKNSPNKDYFLRAKRYLQERGEDSAVVYLMRDADDGHILRGSTRIPLKVRTKDQTYIIKPYDSYDPYLEKQVLQVVSGLMGPQVLHMGQEFYSETLVDFSKYHSLYDLAISTGAFAQDKRQNLYDYMFGARCDQMADRERLMADMVDAVLPYTNAGAVMHANLAKLGVVYEHNHWMDEFHISEHGCGIITDFGTSHFFQSPDSVGELPGLKKMRDDLGVEYHANIRDEDLCSRYNSLDIRCIMLDEFCSILDRIEQRGPGLFFGHASDRFSLSALDGLKYLENNHVLAANLVQARSSSREGLKRFFENAAVGSGVNYLQLLSKDYDAAFLESYFS